MRDIPIEMAARIESGAAMLCHAWVLRRGDGAVLGFTDHDRDLTVEGVVCRAGSGWTAGAREGAVGLASGGLSASGGLDDEAITEGDIAAGRYDGARVELWRIDWTKPALRVRLWAGTLARIRRENGAFVADLDGPMAALERVVGRTYGRTCDAVLGDARCGLSAEPAVLGGWRADGLRPWPGAGSRPGDLGGAVPGEQEQAAATAAGAAVDGLVVVLDRNLPRVEMSAGERALPRLWRAGPAGAPPGGRGEGARMAVAQWGEGYGWGTESVVGL